jgi:hypothetical protein
MWCRSSAAPPFAASVSSFDQVATSSGSGLGIDMGQSFAKTSYLLTLRGTHDGVKHRSIV